MTNDEVIKHYDNLIDDRNDPVNDTSDLQRYMDKWDGEIFKKLLNLTMNDDVFEVGIGTGRIATKIISDCRTLTGIDISPKTIERARKHLNKATLICDDFLTHIFECQYDLIYSSLTFLHFKDKRAVLKKIRGLLKENGRIVISLTKDNSNALVYGDHSLIIYPNDLSKIMDYIKEEKLMLRKQVDIENATVLVLSKIL